MKSWKQNAHSPSRSINRRCTPANAARSIERRGSRSSILYDGGLTPTALARNLDVLQIPVKELRALVVSHGHADHHGGLEALFRRELERVEGITQNAQAVSSNAAALSSVFATTLGGPAIKVAAFSYGIRRAAMNLRRVEADRAAREAATADRRARRARRRAGL